MRETVAGTGDSGANKCAQCLLSPSHYEELYWGYENIFFSLNGYHLVLAIRNILLL